MEQQPDTDKAKKAIVGFLMTLGVALATRLITALLESESFAHAVEYVGTNFPFLFSAIATAATGGYFAQKWTGKC